MEIHPLINFVWSYLGEIVHELRKRDIEVYCSVRFIDDEVELNLLVRSTLFHVTHRLNKNMFNNTFYFPILLSTRYTLIYKILEAVGETNGY